MKRVKSDLLLRFQREQQQTRAVLVNENKGSWVNGLCKIPKQALNVLALWACYVLQIGHSSHE